MENLYFHLVRKLQTNNTYKHVHIYVEYIENITIMFTVILGVMRLFSVPKWYCGEVRSNNSFIIHYTIVFSNFFVENFSVMLLSYSQKFSISEEL